MNNARALFCIAAVVAASAVSAPVARAQVKPGAHVVHLPGLAKAPDGSGLAGSFAAAINDRGVVAGHSFVFASDKKTLVQRAAAWSSRDTVVTGVALPIPASQSEDAPSAALAINNHGQIVGWAGLPKSRRAVLWNPDGDGGYTAVDLGTLGGPESVALGINDAGKVVGWSHVAETGFRGGVSFPCTPAPTPNAETCHYRHAFAWTAGVGLQDLGVPQPQFASPWYESRATAINNRDQIVGDNANELSPFGAAWVNGEGRAGFIGTPTAIGDAVEPNSSRAIVQEWWAVLGRTIGWTPYWGSSLTRDVPGPMLYSKGFKVTTEPTLTNATALGLNEAGAVVGFGHAANGQHAFLRHGGWIRDLNTELDPQITGWTLHVATDINNANEIVGTGRMNGPACSQACSQNAQAFVIRVPGLCAYSIPDSTLHLGPKAVTVPFPVTADADCRWTAVDIPAMPSWLAVQPLTEGGMVGDGTVTFEIGADTGDPYRTTQHEVAGHLVTLMRRPFVSVTFAPASSNVAWGAGTGATTLAAPFGYDWHLSTTAPWLTLTGPTSGTGGFSPAAVTYAFSPNPSIFPRTASIRVTIDGVQWGFQVTQGPAPTGFISGTVTTDGAPLAGVTVVAYTLAGTPVAGASSGPSGAYQIRAAVGSYYVRTFNSASLTDEVWDDVACLPVCVVTAGSVVPVVEGETTRGIDFRLTRVDKVPPAISSVTPSVASLWAPNHTMVPVTIAVIATDNSGAAPACQVTGVTSSEPADGRGDAVTLPDWRIVDATRVELRAERSGQGAGRVYTVGVECRDAAGNRATASTTVTVAHDMRK